MENQEEFTNSQYRILDAYQEHIKEKVSKIRGVNVSFNQPYLGSWQGNYEPSLNMTLSISPNADTGAISGLLFDIAENTSQDAFILEERSEIEDRTPLTEFDEAGMMHYPQIRVNFKNQLSVAEKSIIAQRLKNNKVEDFSIDGDYFIVSIIDFNSKTYEQKKKFYDEKHATITTLFREEGERVGTNKVKDIQEHIRKSRYVAARNAEDEQSQTREYDRSDLFEAQSPNIISQSTGEQGARNLDQVSKAFNEGVEAVAKLANEYNKEFGIDSLRVNFDKQLSVAEKSIIAQRLKNNGVEEFSIDGDYFIVSIIDLNSETNEQKKEFYAEKSTAITTPFRGEGEKIGTNRVKDIQNHFRKSKSVAARNAGDEQSQTRGEYDRSDLFEAQPIGEQGVQNLDQVSKAFNEGVEAVAKLANEYNKEFGIDSLRVNFNRQLSVAEKSIIAQRLKNNGVEEFSIDGDYFIVSIIDFNSETNEQKKEFYAEKATAITTLFTGEGEKIGTNKVKDIQNHFRKSKFVGARNEGDEQSQTREYDRSDLFEAQSPNIISQSTGEQGARNLEQVDTMLASGMSEADILSNFDNKKDKEIAQDQINRSKPYSNHLKTAI